MRVRSYGNIPYTVALIHGGPGAAGTMEPVARTLITKGILEPIQNACSVDGQIDELKTTLEQQCDQPLILVGHSWGAWLAWLLAAQHGALVKKLILVGAGPFEDRYVPQISINRLSRLNDNDKREYQQLLGDMHDQSLADKSNMLDRLGFLADKADTYEKISDPPPITSARFLTNNPSELYARVWPEAALLRKSGALLHAGSSIKCPVVAIHGDCDSHPVCGVQEPLSAVLQNFKMIVLERCGHTPWCEKLAVETFYAVLEDEIGASV